MKKTRWWLQAMFKYYETPPKNIYVKADPKGR